MQAKPKVKEVRYRNMMSLENGSFHRVWTDGAIAQYMNGDHMGVVDKVPKDCVETATAKEANKHMPKCCRSEA